MKKKYLLLFVSILSLNCSNEGIDTESSSEGADLKQQVVNSKIVSFLPKKEFDNSSRGKYVGVFGNTQNRNLHGKIFIDAGNYNEYRALIQLVNGEQLSFIGNLTDEAHIFFEGKRGSFTFISEDYLNPEVENINIDTELGGYIKLKKAFNRAAPLVVIGTYEETGNAANFFGNWDIIGDASHPGFQFIDEVIVSHLGTGAPLYDSVFEATIATGCSHGNMPRIYDLNGNGGVNAISSDNQESLFNNHISSWGLMWQGYEYYDDFCNNLGPDAGGSWTRNGRTGKIFVTTW